MVLYKQQDQCLGANFNSLWFMCSSSEKAELSSKDSNSVLTPRPYLPFLCCKHTSPLWDNSFWQFLCEDCSFFLPSSLWLATASPSLHQKLILHIHQSLVLLGVLLFFLVIHFIYSRGIWQRRDANSTDELTS